MADLSGKVAWITGGSSGIGFSGAFALAKAGAQVIISGRGLTRLDSAREKLRAVGNAETAPLDTTDSKAVARTAAEIVQKHGHVDILVNSAGGNIENGTFTTCPSPVGTVWWRSIFQGYSIASSKYCLTCASARTDLSSMSPPGAADSPALLPAPVISPPSAR